MRWSEFAAAAPELAGIGRDRLATRNVMVLATLRADGSPRISAVNPFFVGEELLIGSMRSAKVADLLRDARCAVHSAIVDGDGAEGEFRAFGRATEVKEPTIRNADPSAWWVDMPTDSAWVFSFDVESAVYVKWDWNSMTYEQISWSPSDGVRRATHGGGS